MTSARRSQLLRSSGALALLAALLAGCGEDGSDAADGDPGTSQDAAHGSDHWSYADVDDWDATCASGVEQSPIDLTAAAEEDLADLELDYRPVEATVIDTGHSIQVTPDGAGTMTREGVASSLVQLHVHTPSEHHLDGAAYPAELHLVHQTKDGALAVLGVLIEEGAASPAVEDVLEVLPAEGTELAGVVADLDVATLLPADLRAFHYAGSLTTPPCTEGVAWSVLAEPVTWSAEQIEAFAARHPDSARPPQSLGERDLVLDVS